MGFWGWEQNDGWLQIVMALALPITAAAIWAVLAVPNDTSRSGSAPIAVHGILRLTIEFSFFALSIWAIYDLGFTKLSWIIGFIVVVHYIISYDRIKWLMNH